jgi:hypothetical protein
MGSLITSFASFEPIAAHHVGVRWTVVSLQGHPGWTEERLARLSSLAVVYHKPGSAFVVLMGEHYPIQVGNVLEKPVHTTNLTARFDGRELPFPATDEYLFVPVMA